MQGAFISKLCEEFCGKQACRRAVLSLPSWAVEELAELLEV